MNGPRIPWGRSGYWFLAGRRFRSNGFTRTWSAVRSVSAALAAGAFLSACGGDGQQVLTATGPSSIPSVPNSTSSTTSRTPSSTPANAQDFSGVYTLTITGGTVCFPADLTVPDRIYSAVLTHTGNSASVKLSGANLIVGGAGAGSSPRGDGFAGSVDSYGFSFLLDRSSDEPGTIGYPDVAERLPDGRVIAILGEAIASPASSGLSGYMNGGVIEVYPSGTEFGASAPELGYCTGLMGFTLVR